MNGGFATIGDFFPDKDIRCSVPGCNNLRPKKAGPAPEGEQFLEHACETCRQRYPQLSDQSVPCAQQGCTETWIWTRREQLESMAAGQKRPPARLCAACQSRLKALTDREMPCRSKGCTHTWIWTAKQQMQHGPDAAPPTRFCPKCFDAYQRLRDQAMPCRLRGCANTWQWTAFRQLEHLVAGNLLDENLPQRLCDDCFKLLGTLADKELPCKIKGCKRTWTYTAFMQLENLKQNGPEAPEPARMCRECLAFLQSAQDEPLPCRFRGCKNTWAYTKAMKLHDWLTGRKRPPVRSCQECTAKLKQAADKPMPCSVPGCPNTWSYGAEEQIRDQALGRQEPSPRRCAECEAFLAATQPQELACPACGAVISWSAYEQLMVKLGKFARPDRCFSCAEKQLVAQKPIELPRTHHQVVRMPGPGAWNDDPRLSAWPPHITRETIAKAEAADIRIVVLGDDISYGSPKVEETWPFMLEQELAAAAGGRSVAVINASIPQTTSAQAAVCLPRDVRPFGPHLVIFSFAFADGWIRPGPRQEHPEYLLPPEESDAAMDRLCQKLKKLDTKLLYWTTNPILPELYQRENPDKILIRWMSLQQANKLRCLAHAIHACAASKIPVLDLRSRFEVNGVASATKWMQDWYMPNETGTRNIALWFAEHILREKLLPLED